MSEPITATAVTTAESTPLARLWRKVCLYWKLIKSLQTGLLLFTGLAGYLSAAPEHSWAALSGVAGSLFLTISGSTMLNMVHDRDIDAIMPRTCMRPLPTGEVTPREAMLLGLVLSGIGLMWAFAIMPLYGAVVFMGLFFDVVVYTLWLKRRTPYSIIWGGISGGMPALAGRVFGVGEVDAVGLMLALAVLFWIPTHIMTFSIKYAEDYQKALVPVFPNHYGEKTTRKIIAISTVMAAVLISLSAWQIGLCWGYLHATVILGAMMILLAVGAAIFTTSKLNHILFKSASLYMLVVMILIIIGVKG